VRSPAPPPSGAYGGDERFERGQDAVEVHGVSGVWPLLEPPILAALAAEPPVGGQPIRVRRARLGSGGVAIGAASHARMELGAVTPV